MTRHTKSIVLRYHRVGETASDPLKLVVSASHFQDHLKIITKYFEVSSLESLKRRTNRARLAVTFDDGYSDNFLTAYPLLQEAGVTATFFVTAGSVGSSQEFWWDRLEQVLLAGSPHGTVRLQIPAGDGHGEETKVRFWTNLTDPEARFRAYVGLQERLKILPRARIEVLLESLEAQTGVKTVLRDGHRPLNEEEVAVLGRDGMVEVGSHSITHSRLTSLDSGQVFEEAEGSRKALEQMSGQRIRMFAYPFGSRDAFNSRTQSQIGRCGYKVICTAIPGLVRRSTPLLMCPRYTVRDWDGLTFHAKLSAWLGGVL